MLDTILAILEEFGTGSDGPGVFCAEIRALQLDKARLDYLTGQAPGKRWKVRYEKAGGGFWTLHSFDAHDVVTLRRAIDKARDDIAQAGSLDSG